MKLLKTERDAFEWLIKLLAASVAALETRAVCQLAIWGASAPEGASQPGDLWGQVGVTELDGELVDCCGTHFGIGDVKDSARCLVGE
ncbi:MAG: hypothetical protein F4Y27_01740 [Acidimicrobiaceae bacterium]|nr:hypothetical protein [Acidimicrobiaceae bacterium]MYG54826.1 hypothetical protein [Acidimicrobiaceae bacterium]MYJ99224.1 hypothetical protein [Acidimicrobiaceae bacterium]